MKKIVIVLALFLVSKSIFAQKINGQWRGYFDSKGDIIQANGDNTEYVLEIELNGNAITGYSYSYFHNRRYFVICSLAGTYYKSTNTLKVTETARIKGSTPKDWHDCLQTHILTYEKQGSSEELKGRWVPAEGQQGGCGKGLTTLTRRTLSKDLASYNKSIASAEPVKKPTDKPFSNVAGGTKKTTPTAPVAAKSTKSKSTVTSINKPVDKTKAVVPVTKPVPKKAVPIKIDSAIASNKLVDRNMPEMAGTTTKKQVVPTFIQDGGFELRSSDVIKTIEVSHPTFTVELYDNGDIDGDSISLFYNSKLLLSHKRLGDKPITLTLDASTGKEINELTMYAENLGLYPPNTALMVVTDGEKRYEVRIASDLKKSGTIRFAHTPNP